MTTTTTTGHIFHLHARMHARIRDRIARARALLSQQFRSGCSGCAMPAHCQMRCFSLKHRRVQRYRCATSETERRRLEHTRFCTTMTANFSIHSGPAAAVSFLDATQARFLPPPLLSIARTIPATANALVALARFSPTGSYQTFAHARTHRMRWQTNVARCSVLLFAALQTCAVCAHTFAPVQLRAAAAAAATVSCRLAVACDLRNVVALRFFMCTRTLASSTTHAHAGGWRRHRV